MGGVGVGGGVVLRMIIQTEPPVPVISESLMIIMGTFLG